MKKKKGFTLIELLAVIVVLAVIALIATPTILGLIDKAQKGSLQDSGYGLLQAADLYYAQYSNGKTVRFDIEDNKITTEEENNLEYKGSVKDGTILINNKGEVTVCINDGKHAAYKNYKDTKVTVVDSKTCTIPENKYIVYLDGESTITELNNQELTQEIENLKQLIKEQNEKIEMLESEKSNQTDVTNSVSNLKSQHDSDISSLNSKFSNYLHLTNGGTVTGPLTLTTSPKIKDNTKSLDNSTGWGIESRYLDKDGNRIYYINPYFKGNGTADLYMGTDYGDVYLNGKRVAYTHDIKQLLFYYNDTYDCVEMIINADSGDKLVIKFDKTSITYTLNGTVMWTK